MEERKFGWIPQQPDFRDLKFSVSYEEIQPIKSVYLSDKYKLPLPYNQGSLGSCHDPETEVLTNEGFKKFSELTGYEALATVNPATSELFFEMPTQYFMIKHIGKLICGKHSNLDFKVTPNHKMLVRKWNQKDRKLDEKYTFVEAGELGWYSGLMNNVKWLGHNAHDVYKIKGVEHKLKVQREDKIVKMSSWLKFLGIFIAEGTVLKEEYKIQIAAVKEREKRFIREVLGEVGIHALELKDRFTFSNKQIYTELSNLGFFGIKAPQKFVPNFVFNQTTENINNFLLGHFMGDGSESNFGKSHYTSSTKLGNDLQILLFMSGKNGTLRTRKARQSVMSDGRILSGKYDEHRIGVSEKLKLAIDKKEHITEENYDGYVYCAEMPTYHTLVTRRNGRILIAGNCTANGIGFLVHFDLLNNHSKSKGSSFQPSRLFIYYFERLAEGTVNDDAGAIIRDGIKVIANEGVCNEDAWPYDVSQFTVRPNTHAIQLAKEFQALEYKSLDNTNKGLLVNCLLQGFPITFGMSVYESFMSNKVASTGIVPMPRKTESMIGGHCMAIVGYSLDFDAFIVRNSWGMGWGQKGYCRIPAEYLCNRDLASDFWAITMIE